MPWPFGRKENDPAQLRRSVQHNGGFTLLTEQFNVGNDEEVWALPYRGLDLVIIVGGTAGKTSKHYSRLLHVQRIQTSNLVAMICVFTTKGDLDSLGKSASVSQYVTRRKPEGFGALTVELPNRGLILAKHIRTLGNYDGSGSDPEFAVHVLSTDPLPAADVQALMVAGVAKAHEHNLTACDVMKIVGLGGSYPYADLAETYFRRLMRVNHHHEVVLIPCPRQPQNLKVAKEWLAHRLSGPVPDNAVLYVVQLDQPGEQDWDAALAAGMMTVTGTDHEFGQPDKSNIFNMFRERTDVVTVKPRVLHLPLRRAWRNPLQKREVLYDAAVPVVLAEIKRMVDEEDEDAWHLFAVAGEFSAGQVQELHRHAHMLHKRGRIQVLVNRMVAASQNGTTAEFYVIDYVVQKGQPKPLIDLAGLGDDTPLPVGANGLAREALVERLGRAHGANTPRRVEAAIQQIAESRRCGWPWSSRCPPRPCGCGWCTSSAAS